MIWRSTRGPALVAAAAIAVLIGAPLSIDSEVAALDPPVEHTVLSEATLPDPLNISLAGPTKLDIAMLTIRPGRTTGPRRYAGPTLVSVVSGTAIRYGDSCRTRSILPGVAYFIAAGGIDELGNDGVLPLRVQTTSLTPAPGGLVSAAAGGVACGSAGGFAAAVLSHSVIAGPLHIVTAGPIVILTSRFRLPPGVGTGWHSHPGGMLVSVDEGHFHWVFAKDGRCGRRESPAGSGYWEAPEPAAEVHDYRNDSARPATFHYVGFTTSRGPLVIPQAPAPTCTVLAPG